MVRTVRILFCANDHGVGDETFPRIDDLDVQAFIAPLSAKTLRAAAREAGWSHHAGEDYCDSCTQGGIRWQHP